MKNALRRIFADSRPAEPPVFGGPLDPPISAAARNSLRAPIVAGTAIILVCVVGLGLWATFAPIWGAVVAPGSVRVEDNRRTLKSRDGGVVRAINVANGDLVQPGQLLIQLDDTVALSQVAVLTNQYDVALMQRARYLAEVGRQRMVAIPAELAGRTGDPRVAATVQNETLVFSSRLAAIEGQAAILNQRFAQLQTAQSGLNVQVRSIDDQVALIQQELEGYQTLYEKGFAPKTLILRLQRQLAEIAGRRGALVADITRNQQQAGETRLQLAQLYEQRETEAATGLRDAEAQLSDLSPRLNSARDNLAQTRIVSPDAGYVLNLSQFTIGGVAGAGETMMDVVPNNTPLIVKAQVRPSDIDEVRPGLTAEVTLNAFNANRVPSIEGEVITVSADALTTPETGDIYFEADIRIPPEQLSRLPEGANLYPGMPATTMIRTGRRTIMSYLLGPMGEVVNNSMREQ